MSPLLFHPLHPLRPADFRWQLAIYLADETKQPFHRHDDRFLTIARRFLRLQDSHGSDEFVVANKMPCMQAAYDIYSRCPVARDRIEARVLADEAPEAIALKNGTTEGVILHYENVFFDVRGRREDADYILNAVIGALAAEGMASWTSGMMWKFFAYCGGPIVLDAIMNTAAVGQKPITADEAFAYLSRDTRAAVVRNIAIATRALEPRHPRTSMALTLINARLESAKESAGESNQSDIHKNIAAMLETVGRSLRMSEVPDPDDPMPCAAELRAHEKLALDLGLEVPGLEEIKAYKFPGSDIG